MLLRFKTFFLLVFFTISMCISQGILGKNFDLLSVFLWTLENYVFGGSRSPPPRDAGKVLQPVTVRVKQSVSMLVFFTYLLEFYSGGAVDLWSCFD